MADLFHLSIAAAAAVAGIAASAGSGAEQPSGPVELVTQATQTGVDIRVVGRSDVAADVRYTLEVQAGSGNRSTQSGNAHLLPGAQPVTLVTLRVGSGGASDWTATLRVTGADGTSYTVTRSG
jgi:hypothetical protein